MGAFEDRIYKQVMAKRTEEMKRNVALHFTDPELGLFHAVFRKMNETPFRLNRVLFWGRSIAVEEIRRMHGAGRP